RGGSGLSRSQLTLQNRTQNCSLEARDRRSGSKANRAARGAAHVRVAGMAAGIAGDRAQALDRRPVALILDQGPGAVERRRAEIIRIPGDDVAGAVAHAAADAFDPRIHLPSVCGIGGYASEVVAPSFSTPEAAFCTRPLVEEPAHVGDQIADHRQVAQRTDHQFIFPRDFVYVGPAGPARHAIHAHRARATHADAAGEAVGERRIEVALDVGDDVEHGLAGVTRHLERLEGALRASPPDFNGERAQADSYNRVRTNSRWPRASAAVRRPFAVRNMQSSSLSPAWSGVSSFLSSPETSTSMCSDMVRTVRGLAQSLITGRIGLPMT